MAVIAEDELLSMLADELDAARAELEQLGVRLCSNPATARAHVHDLQSLDHVGQRCTSVAAILRSDDLQAASRDARLESITGRLAALIESLASRQPQH
ncbi:hypothetical protein [Sphingomonas montanisoli]|uniref:Uncharacterized protein n=1 Tax=Sphingomonas montanisoli TaxID=2606412 RepID=A0A5D9C801_9SPHN|nr:hypothetical protein [Sphingomonas montanisoli]TZG26195.1 hypothetical protein FYJ91_14705 [Sphingomonas montanisoli]